VGKRGIRCGSVWRLPSGSTWRPPPAVSPVAPIVASTVLEGVIRDESHPCALLANLDLAPSFLQQSVSELETANEKNILNTFNGRVKHVRAPIRLLLIINSIPSHHREHLSSLLHKTVCSSCCFYQSGGCSTCPHSERLTACVSRICLIELALLSWCRK